MQKYVVLKRVGIGIVSFMALLVLAAVLIPLFVNIDNYRPQIVAAANDQINGKLEIGKLSLSLWGQVEIDIDGLTLTDANGNKLVAVKETYAQISFLSILGGKPKLRFKMTSPMLDIVKDQKGQINLLSLVKPSTSSSVTPTPQPSSVPANVPAQDIPFLALIRAAGIDIELLKADLSFRDLASGLVQKLAGFNLQLMDISMSRPMSLRIWSDIATKMGTLVDLSGPINIVGQINPQFEGLEFKSVAIDLDGNFDDLSVSAAQAFQKAKGIATNFKTSIQASTQRLDVKSMTIHFHNAEITMSALVDKLQTADPELRFDLNAKPIDLSAWSALLPMLKDYELEGKMDLNASANGKISQLAYKANLAIKDFITKAPGLAVKPKMQIGIDIATDELREFRFDLVAPGNDLAVRAQLKSFKAPNINVTVASDSLDLDQLLPPPVNAPASSPAAATKGAAGGGATTVADKPAEPAYDVDSALEPLRTNEMLRKMVATVAVRLKKIKGMQLLLQDLVIDFSFRELVAAIDSFSVQVFKGMIKANANIDIKPHSPTYKLNLSVSNLDIQSAVESQFKSFRNTLLGSLSFKALGGGESLNSDKLMRNLNLNGNLKIADAKFASVDVGKVLVEAINGSINDIAKQIPAVKGKSLPGIQNLRSRYKSIGGDFSMRNGVFLSPNFATVAVENEGIDVVGRTQADLINDKLDADWSIVDTYDTSKARDLGVDINGVMVKPLIAKGNDPVSFPIKVGCKISAPCYDYAAVPKHLGGIALENSRAAVKGIVNKEINKAKEQAKKEVAKEVEKAKSQGQTKAKEKLNKEADKLKKRFGF